MNDIKFSSGRKIQWGSNKLPIYTDGQINLSAALLDLPPHPLDKDKNPWIVPLMEAIDLVPDEVLHVVAEDIVRQSGSPLASLPPDPARPLMKCRPRLADIKLMCAAVMRMDATLAKFTASRATGKAQL